MAHNLMRFLGYLKPHRSLLAGAIFAGVIRYLIPLILPWVIKILVDQYLIESSMKSRLDLHILMLSLTLAYIVYAAASYFRSCFVGFLGNRVMFDLRSALYAHLQKMSLGYFERRKVGEIISRITDDINTAQILISSGVVNMIMDLCFVSLALGILVYIHPKLALISLWVIPCFVLANYRLAEKIRKKSSEVLYRSAEIHGELHEQFSTVFNTQVFCQEENEAGQFRQHSVKFLNSIFENIKLQAVALAITGFLTALGPIFVLWLGAMEVMNGALSAGSLIAFYSYLGLLYQPVQRFTELGVQTASSLGAIDRVFETFDTKSDIVEHPNAAKLPASRGPIIFDHVTFGYSIEARSIHDLSLCINDGDSVALVGSSGCGKSTLLKLIMRFYKPDKGRILINNMDISQVSLKSLRSSITFIAQEPILLYGTVRENLIYANTLATDEEILKALMAAYADEFVMKLPQGLNSMIGEKGVNLSSGQKQRIAIARAFLKNSSIVLMDEPTSSLDSLSESLIQRALKELLRDRTTVTIAHRLKTIEESDKIYVMDHGRIIEWGSHSDLMSLTEGRYRKLVDIQISDAPKRLIREA